MSTLLWQALCEGFLPFTFRLPCTRCQQNEEVNKEMEELYAVFQSLDSDGSGALSAQEVGD